MKGRRVIVTADDFGLSTEVNEAVERAHREGILSTASLMVAAPASADAIRRARELPALHVGLHVVLVNGRPALPPECVPDLVDTGGNLPSNLAGAGVKFFFNPRARRQLALEIRAQFEAFKASGLVLDHLNAQNHMHVHPTVLGLILRIGPDFGLRAVRIPREPFGASWRSARSNLAARLANAIFLAPWLTAMAYRVRRAGLAANDYVFGMNDTGHMEAGRVLAIVEQLPGGVSELYFHPSAGDAEAAALIDPAVVRSLRAPGIELLSFGALADGRAS